MGLMKFRNQFHRSYYNSKVFKRTRWKGVRAWKYVGDLWNYQELIYETKPEALIEVGASEGGSGLFFHDTGLVKVVGIDIVKHYEDRGQYDLFIHGSSVDESSHEPLST